ncbi:dTMP kinase [Runella limosa]|uniref:dTMP kinase n=1 Tax=Runella limosa TaxID=370978 RepID=UPI0004223DF9|nr:dTMP kinase [Runella limosa]
MFITVDGINGVGKSSIIKKLKIELKKLKLKVFLTKEPTDSFLGNFVRKSENDLNGIVYTCLIASDRYYHIEKEIIPKLKKNLFVISDRYIESSLALQSLDGVDINFIWNINSKIIIPDLSIILTGDPRVVEERMKKRKALSRFERKYSRKQEIEKYKVTSNFLIDKGFNLITINNTENSIEKTVMIIIEEIQILLKKP